MLLKINSLGFIGILFVLLTYGDSALANTEQMNVTLARVTKVLNQINPLINQAQKQEDPNVRVKFQFNALRKDIAQIQLGIAQAVNRVSIQPRVVKPLSGDYLPASGAVLNKEKKTS